MRTHMHINIYFSINLGQMFLPIQTVMIWIHFTYGTTHKWGEFHLCIWQLFDDWWVRYSTDERFATFYYSPVKKHKWDKRENKFCTYNITVCFLFPYWECFQSFLCYKEFLNQILYWYINGCVLSMTIICHHADILCAGNYRTIISLVCYLITSHKWCNLKI